MFKPKRKRGKCRTAKCKNVAQWRDVCQSCKRELDALVDSGEFTDKQLVDAGAWAPMKRPGRPRNERVAVGALKKKLAKVG